MDLCKPFDFLAFSAFASTTKGKTTVQEAKPHAEAYGQAPQPTSSLPTPTSSAKGPDVAAPGPTFPSGSTLVASNVTKIGLESTVKLSAVDSQAKVSPATISSSVDRLPAAVESPSEPDLERSFTREGLLRFMPRLREQLPKDLFAQVEAYVHAEEEDGQSGGEEDFTAKNDSASFTQDSLPSTTPPLVGAIAEQTRSEPSPPTKVITTTELKSSKGANALLEPSALLSVVEDSANIEHPSIQSTTAAATRLHPERPAHGVEGQAKLRKGVIVEIPPRAVNSKDSVVSSLQQESRQTTVPTRSGRQSLAQSLKRQREALIGEHVHKSRFSSTTASLEKQFARLRISETDASQGTLPDTIEEPSSASHMASRRKGPTLPSFLQAIEKESDPGAAARRQYSGNLEPRSSADLTGFKPETSRQEKPRSASSSTANPLPLPTSRIIPRTGQGPKLPAWLRPGGLPLGSQAATHAAPSVPGRIPLKENQNPFARRPNPPNVISGSQPLANMANTNTSTSSTPPHLKSRRTKPSGPGVPSYLQELMAAQKKGGVK